MELQQFEALHEPDTHAQKVQGWGQGCLCVVGVWEYAGRRGRQDDALLCLCRRRTHRESLAAQLGGSINLRLGQMAGQCLRDDRAPQNQPAHLDNLLGLGVAL